MLRLVLLVLYLIASSSDRAEQGGMGLNVLPLSSATEAGAGNDPNGASPPAAEPTSDAGAGYDPNG